MSTIPEEPIRAALRTVAGWKSPSAPSPFAAPAQVHTPPKIAHDQRIFDRFVGDLRACGVVGEDRNAKVIFLSLTSRLLDEPVSVAMKGTSSSGKSYTVDTTLKFFPEDAYIQMTAMSERALVYMEEDFAHRTLVMFEAVALREQREKVESNQTAYFIRSLLSEGRLIYRVSVPDKHGGWIGKKIVKNGPTNIILTTTATSLHPENETRMLSLPTNDTQAQTRAVLLQLATEETGDVDFSEWHDLQRWLAGADRRVTIPCARQLAETIPPVAVRLRRDFKTILRLIATHALLHQINRDRDERGRIIATEQDYLAVRELVADLIADGVGAAASATTRETVDTVRGLTADRDPPIGATVQDIAGSLKLDRSAAQRRLKAAKEQGYLVNLEDRPGRPARYAIGENLPGERDLLPEYCTPVMNEPAGQERVCSSADAAEDENVLSQDDEEHEDDRRQLAEAFSPDDDHRRGLDDPVVHARPMATVRERALRKHE